MEQEEVSVEFNDIIKVLSCLSTNKKDSSLSLNCLNQLQLFLCQSKTRAILNSLEMMKHNALDILEDLLEIQIESNTKGSIIIKLSETIYYIINAFIVCDLIDGKIIAFIEDSDGLVKLMNAMKIIPLEYQRAFSLLLDAYQIILRWLMNNQPHNFQGSLTFLFSIYETREISSQVSKSILTAINRVLLEQDSLAIQVIEEREEKLKESNIEYYWNIICPISNNSKDKEEIIRVIQIIITLLRGKKCIEYIRSNHLIKMIISVKEKYSNDKLINYYLTLLLTKAILIDDISPLIAFIESKEVKSNNSIIKQIILYSNQNDIMTQTILILIELLIPERSFIKQFNYFNTITLLSNILPFYKDLENNHNPNDIRVIRLFNIIFTLLTDDEINKGESNSKLFTQISSQISRSFIQFINNKPLIKFVLLFFCRQGNQFADKFFYDTIIKYIETLCIAILHQYPNKNWVYFFLSRLSLSVIYRKKYINQGAFFSEDCLSIKKMLDQSNISSNDKLLALELCDILSIKLLMKPGEKELIDPNIINTLLLTIKKVIAVFICNELNEDNENNVEAKVISIITLVFAIIERKTKVNENDNAKCQPLFESLRLLVLYQSLSLKTIKYLSHKLLSLDDKKNEKMLSIVLSNNNTTDYIIFGLSTILGNPQIGEETYCIIKDILGLIKLLISVQSQLNNFIQQRGIDLLLDLITKSNFTENKSVSLLIEIFTLLSLDKALPDLMQISEDELALQSYLSTLTEIKYSNINDLLFNKLLLLTKNILIQGNHSRNTQAIEDSNIIIYLMIEFQSIYFNCVNPKNQSLILILDIISLLSNKVEIQQYLLDISFIKVIEIIMIEILSNPIKYEAMILSDVVTIFCNLIQANNYSNTFYELKAGRNIISIVKDLSLVRGNIFEANLISSLFEQLILYENKGNSRERIISHAFLNDLKLKLPNESKGDLNQSKVDILMKHISSNNNIKKTQSNKQLISNSQWENNKLLQELYVIIGGKEYIKTLDKIQLTNNNELKNYYDQLLTNLNNQLKLIQDKIINQVSIDKECTEISLLLYILNDLAKDESNINQMCSDGLLTYLIALFDNDKVSLFVQNQAFLLLETMLDYPSSITTVLSDQSISHFFIKEYNKRIKFCSEEISERLRSKVIVITKLISKLTLNKNFLEQHTKSIGIVDICKALSIILKQKDIIIHLLKILQNVISNSNEYISHIDKLAESVTVNVWKKYSYETDVLIEIMNMIELLHKDANFLKELMKKGIVKLFQVHLNKGNAEKHKQGFLRLFMLFNSLSYYQNFIDEITALAKDDLIKALEINISDYDITLQGLKLLNTNSFKDQKYIAMISSTPINAYCMATRKYYISSDKLDILELLLSLIYSLLIEEKNKKYFANDDQLNQLILVISAKLDHAHILALSFDIVISLLDPSLQNHTDGGEKASHVEDLEYNLNLLNMNINNIIKQYRGNIDILNKCCIIIENVLLLDIELQMKHNFLSLLIDNINALITDEYIEQMELFLSFIRSMSDTRLTMSEKQALQCVDVFNDILKAISINILNPSVMKIILQIIKNILNQKGNDSIMNSNSSFPAINKIEVILLWMKSNKKFHTNYNIPVLSKIIKTLCLTNSYFMREKNNNDFSFFLLEYANEIDISLPNYVSIIEDAKTIVTYSRIDSNEEASAISTLLYDMFQKNYKGKYQTNLIIILQILSSLIGSFDILKNEFKQEEKNLKKDIQNIINEGTDNKLLSYQLRGVAMLLEINRCSSIDCKMNMIEDSNNNIDESEDQLGKIEIKKTKTINNPSLPTMEVLMNRIEIGAEIMDFLKQKRKIKLYTEMGVVEDLTMRMENDSITAKDTYKTSFQEMPIKEMDSIVRSCSGAFNKRKLFSKKPKAANCFSILPNKNIKTIMKSFNVECEDEETCVKYVDYLSILINNTKAK